METQLGAGNSASSSASKAWDLAVRVLAFSAAGAAEAGGVGALNDLDVTVTAGKREGESLGLNL